MRREKFRCFLVTAYRGKESGRSLSHASATSYCAKAERVETHLNVRLEGADLSERGIAVLLDRLRATGRLNDKSLNECGSALRAYAQFIDGMAAGATAS